MDCWAAAEAARLRIPLYLYLPLPVEQFAAGWPKADRVALERAWSYAAAPLVFGSVGDEASAAYQARNALLAERGDLLIVVWGGQEGGGRDSAAESGFPF